MAGGQQCERKLQRSRTRRLARSVRFGRGCTRPHDRPHDRPHARPHHRPHHRLPAGRPAGPRRIGGRRRRSARRVRGRRNAVALSWPARSRRLAGRGAAAARRHAEPAVRRNVRESHRPRNCADAGAGRARRNAPQLHALRRSHGPRRNPDGTGSALVRRARGFPRRRAGRGASQIGRRSRKRLRPVRSYGWRSRESAAKTVIPGFIFPYRTQR